MGIFGDMVKPEEKSEHPREEKKYKPESKKQKKGIVSSIIKDRRIIVDVDGTGESVFYNEKEHGHLKVGDLILF